MITLCSSKAESVVQREISSLRPLFLERGDFTFRWSGSVVGSYPGQKEVQELPKRYAILAIQSLPCLHSMPTSELL